MWRKTLQIQKEGKKPAIDKTVQWQDNAVAATKALNSTFRNLHKRKKFNTKSHTHTHTLSLSLSERFSLNKRGDPSPKGASHSEDDPSISTHIQENGMQRNNTTTKMRVTYPSIHHS
jgi:hypothetical protein